MMASVFGCAAADGSCFFCTFPLLLFSLFFGDVLPTLVYDRETLLFIDILRLITMSYLYLFSLPRRQLLDLLGVFSVMLFGNSANHRGKEEVRDLESR